jgi:hypothetical protein
MNEWQLQSHLTHQWTKNPLIHKDRKFYLIAWELMFPSWGINRNTGKWNEVSVDFILFDGEKTFLCLELKNEIKSRKPLLSAYCQASHRTSLFIEQYDREKMQRAQEDCFSSNDARALKNQVNFIPSFSFPKTPKVISVLAARRFPHNAEDQVERWNSMPLDEMKVEIQQYTPTKEMKRFMDMTASKQRVEMIVV